jgi:hypothetical protein
LFFGQCINAQNQRNFVEIKAKKSGVVISWSLTCFGNHGINHPIFQQTQGRPHRFLLPSRIHHPAGIQLVTKYAACPIGRMQPQPAPAGETIELVHLPLHLQQGAWPSQWMGTWAMAGKWMKDLESLLAAAADRALVAVGQSGRVIAMAKPAHQIKRFQLLRRNHAPVGERIKGTLKINRIACNAHPSGC